MAQEIQYIPDISHHQSNPTTGARISIARIRDEGATAVIARVGQGAGVKRNGIESYGTTRDRMWQTFLSEAKSIGFPILPYWYIGNRISAADNAAIAADWVGDKNLKWMLDHEDASGDIAFYNAVLNAFEKRGLHVVLGYVPHWYWSIFGGGIAGPPLVNSKYLNSRIGYASQIYGDGTAYASAWAGYGGNQVVMVQFTNQAQMAGWKIDCSAFRGTREQFFSLIGGSRMATLDGEDLKAIEDRVYGAVANLLIDGAAHNPAAGKGDQAQGALRTILNVEHITDKIDGLDRAVGATFAAERGLLGEVLLRVEDKVNSFADIDTFVATLAPPLVEAINNQGAGGGLTEAQAKAALLAAMAEVNGTINFSIPPAG